MYEFLFYDFDNFNFLNNMWVNCCLNKWEGKKWNFFKKKCDVCKIEVFFKNY